MPKRRRDLGIAPGSSGERFGVAGGWPQNSQMKGMEHTAVPAGWRRERTKRARPGNLKTEVANQGGGDEVSVDLGGHHPGPIILGLAHAQGGLHVEIKERTKEDEAGKRRPQEALNGGRVVPVDMIGVPAVDQLTEALVLDFPSLVSESDTALGGNLSHRQRGSPHPVAGL